MGAGTRFAVTADGQRFLAPGPDEVLRLPITVVMNWTAALKR
jgi:hypothetical protein